MISLEVRFFGQFPLPADQRIFTRDIEQASRYLPVHGANRVTVLANHHYLVTLVESDNCDSPGVVDIVPAQNLIVVGEGIANNVPDGTLVHRLGAEDRNREWLVFRDEASNHQLA